MKKFAIFFLMVFFLTGCKGIFTDKECSVGFHEFHGTCVEDTDGNEGPFTDGDEIINLYLSFSKKQELLGASRNMMFFGAEETALDAADDSSPTTNDKGSDDYSGTNNQVEGVDEMDNVLTDGEYIYISTYNKVQIVKAYTQADEYDVLSLEKEILYEDLYDNENGHFYMHGMYVDGDRFIIVGTSYTQTCQMWYQDSEKGEEPNPDGDYSDDYSYNYCMYYEYHSMTHIFEYSKDSFELENEYQLSGYYVGSRKVGDDLYFVTNTYIPFYYMDNEEYDFSIDDYIPYYNVNTTTVDVNYESIQYVEGTEPTTFTSFYGVSLDTKEVSTEVILGEGGYNLYVSIENIYLTNTKWAWNDALLLELEKADDPDTVEIDENPYEIETAIIRVAIDEGRVDFEAEGSVPGIALDQFAMDENDGHVRIVTTTNNWWWGWWMDSTPEINNRLMVLDMELNIVSTLEGIGKEGESVQSTRFVGDYAYIVTFLRTDPFYVIDLSDPENPVKLSELEVPGFSDYLQPVGENYILGIGYGDLDGGTNGLKISLYDVSDKYNAVVASEVIYPYGENGYMWTSTVYNHKDLLLSIDKGIIALPYTEYSWGGNYSSWEYTTGVLVLNLDIENGIISERGRVAHTDTDYSNVHVYKSKFISDYLYTISSTYVKVTTIADPNTELKSLQIGTTDYYYYDEEVID